MTISHILEEYDHVSIDIETYGLSPCLNGMSSIGLCQFDPVSMEIFRIGEARTSFADQFGKSDPDTLMWRYANDVGKYEESIGTKLPNPEHLHTWLSLFLPNPDKTLVWSWHSQFDIAFLNAMFDKANLPHPWKHSRVMDIPSFLLGCNRPPKHVQNLLWNLVSRSCKQHIAKDDATVQAMATSIGIHGFGQHVLNAIYAEVHRHLDGSTDVKPNADEDNQP